MWPKGIYSAHSSAAAYSSTAPQSVPALRVAWLWRCCSLAVGAFTTATSLSRCGRTYSRALKDCAVLCLSWGGYGYQVMHHTISCSSSSSSGSFWGVPFRLQYVGN
jgi:hypothetical protein